MVIALTYGFIPTQNPIHPIEAEKRLISGRLRDDRSKSERFWPLPPHDGRSNYLIF
jgi:hypothetical protein